MAQVALAWCMSKNQVTAPVVGTTNLRNLEELFGEQIAQMLRPRDMLMLFDLKAPTDIKLTEEEIKHLDYSL
jgi:aryl-alcohol dehydrogenase-like predicted oxidoreductase